MSNETSSDLNNRLKEIGDAIHSVTTDLDEMAQHWESQIDAIRLKVDEMDEICTRFNAIEIAIASGGKYPGSNDPIRSQGDPNNKTHAVGDVFELRFDPSQERASWTVMLAAVDERAVGFVLPNGKRLNFDCIEVISCNNVPSHIIDQLALPYKWKRIRRGGLFVEQMEQSNEQT